MFSPTPPTFPRWTATTTSKRSGSRPARRTGTPTPRRCCVRRPRDAARFSGTVIAEPLHVHGIAPIWIYTAPYILRSGHAWVEITAQKTTLDMHVKPSNPAALRGPAHRWARHRRLRPDPRLGDPDARAAVLVRADTPESRRQHHPRPGRRRAPEPEGPFDGWTIAPRPRRALPDRQRDQLLHPGRARRAAPGRRLARLRRLLPLGFPLRRVPRRGRADRAGHERGDVALPDYSFRPGYGGRRYRRDDSDEPATATASTNSPASPTWAPATRRSTTCPCGRARTAEEATRRASPSARG